MRIVPGILSLNLALLGASCAEEKNPYSSRYTTGAAAPVTSATNAGPVGSTASSGNAPTGMSTEEAAKDAGTVAKPEAIAKASLAGVQLICSNPPALSKVQAELSVLCLNGQPTQAFANALAAPYKGGANPPLVLIKSVDNNGTSEFIVLAVIEVPKPVAEVFGKRSLLSTGTLTAGNATVTQSVITNVPAAGGDKVGGADIKFDLNVSVGIIRVANTSILQADSTALNTEKSVIATVSALKAGAADNADDILSTSLSFMMQDGNTTKLISVNHQMVNNRGQAATAEQTVTGIGRATMTDTYTKLMQ
ncbi:MAG TPA: hypothetical protein VE954_04920 [Oligoflexus sp.]|uniref:hypothetical protein n=1 Tax=Oligoflexus sp. TaxID=1971216 RepID=UPI002D3CA60B|nr:hypothetical protein [Oligoflexus sp.]HYX32434.1 hypothetical protein [Oligoflexus sp.]